VGFLRGISGSADPEADVVAAAPDARRTARRAGVDGVQQEARPAPHHLHRPIPGAHRLVAHEDRSRGYGHHDAHDSGRRPDHGAPDAGRDGAAARRRARTSQRAPWPWPGVGLLGLPVEAMGLP